MAGSRSVGLSLACLATAALTTACAATSSPSASQAAQQRGASAQTAAPTPTLKEPTPTPKQPTPAPKKTPATPTSALAKILKPSIPKPTTQRPLRVELWGDSASAQTAPYFSFFVGVSGKAVAREHTFGGTALCDWFSDMRSELDPHNKTGFHPQAAVIQFSGDAFTPCMRNQKGIPYSGAALIYKYAADSATAIAIFTRARIRVYFASTPISRTDAAHGDVGNTPLGFMYSRLTARYPTSGLVHFIDAAAAVEWHGHYTDTLPCLSGEACTGRWPDGTKTVVVRQADGGHFCPVGEVVHADGSRTCPVYMPGARRFTLAMASPVLRDFSVS